MNYLPSDHRGFFGDFLMPPLVRVSASGDEERKMYQPAARDGISNLLLNMAGETYTIKNAIAVAAVITIPRVFIAALITASCAQLSKPGHGGAG